jgi:hypothetical protein
MHDRPSFDSLPLHSSDPPYSAWGLYGKDDELGTLNLLNSDCVLKATAEIQYGISISLKCGQAKLNLVPTMPLTVTVYHSTYQMCP